MLRAARAPQDYINAAKTLRCQGCDNTWPKPQTHSVSTSTLHVQSRCVRSRGLSRQALLNPECCLHGNHAWLGESPRASVPRHHMHVYEHSYMVGRVGLLRSHCIHTLLVYKSASVWMQKTVTQFRWWHVWSMFAPSRRRWCRRSRQAARRPRRMYVDRSVFCTQDLTIGDPVGKAWRTSWTNCSVVSWEKTLEHEWFSHHYKPNHDILETQFLSFQDFADRGFSAREDEKLWCWQLDSFVIRQSTSHHGIVFRSIVDIPNICWLWFKITPFKKMSWYVIFLPNLLPVVPPSSPKCTAAFPVSDIIVHQFMI